MAEVATEVIVARTGRNFQRYEEKFRLVAGCIPYRWKETVENGADNLQDRLEVLMISSPNRQDLIFPKGGWENDETIVEAASREALEEAGVRGIIKEPILGEWKFKSKSRQNSCSSEGTCKGYMFAMEVTEELQCWPEQASHDRRWLCTSDAWKICRYDWMREALSSCITFLSGQTLFSSVKLEEPSSYFFPQQLNLLSTHSADDFFSPVTCYQY
ncbi:nudix hydrolase 12, mitochondrial [Dendrobium catenatum]|uniref:Nudix hydrolase 12, mitochondrial n=1 Tax=Dendrobium catenatum TaxID=906689 RepID=A0A2I0X1X4_9ASPA|nr:nudix hydrolase 12, mitochondrial [Dendrobium catenatum]PKU81897.1 Nudix hydrolase 12, mitochondrial [Dendrobium catenatum]